MTRRAFLKLSSIVLTTPVYAFKSYKSPEEIFFERLNNEETIRGETFYFTESIILPSNKAFDIRFCYFEFSNNVPYCFKVEKLPVIGKIGYCHFKKEVRNNAINKKGKKIKRA